jgi:hypothetical protein
LSEINKDKLNNAICEARRHFTSKKIRDLYTGISEFKRGYQPSELIADSHNILNMWKNYFSHLLHVHSVSDVRQIEIHTDEQLTIIIFLRLKLLVHIPRSIICQNVIKFQQK